MSHSIGKVKDFLTTNQAAKRLKCTRQNVNKLRTRAFPGAIYVGIWLYPVEEIERYKKNPFKKTGRPVRRKSNSGSGLKQSA